MNLIRILKQPTSYSCGQTCIAMVTGKTVNEIFSIMKTKRGTTVLAVATTLNQLGYNIEPKLVRISKRNPLPQLAIVKLRKQNTRGQWMRNWHWTVYADGMFYDPYWGEVKEYSIEKHGMKPVSFMKIA